jgi:hypothetical protein
MTRAARVALLELTLACVLGIALVLLAMVVL